MDYDIVLKAREPVTHDTNHYIFARPEGFDFVPGQATGMTLQREGWKDEERPFTFTSQPEDDDLEFVIKTYPDHDGVTARLATLEPGEAVTITPAFGAISDRGGKATFLAAGAGITPFIPILRRRARDGALEDATLIFSNKTSADIILKDEWEEMEGLACVFVVTDETKGPIPKGRVDADFLADKVTDQDQTFYLCGPGGFVDDVRDGLKAIGVPGERIVTEEGW